MKEHGRSALLVGATGLVGASVLQLLLDCPSYERVLVIARRELPIQHPKLEVITTDFDQLEKHASEIAADDVFCCLGTTIAAAGSQEAFAQVDRDYPVAIARLTRANGAQQFLLVSSVGADPNSQNVYLRTKGEVEARIAELGFDAVHILRPSLLLGKRSEFRWKEKLTAPLARLFGVAIRGSLTKYRPIEASAVARAMVNIAHTEVSGLHTYQGDELRRFAEKSSLRDDRRTNAA